MRVAKAPRTPRIFSYTTSLTRCAALRKRALGPGESLRRKPLPVEHVHEIEVHGDLTVRDRGDAADDDVIGAAAPPVRDEHVLAAGRLDGHLPARQRLEAPAALEVPLHHFRDVEAAVRRRGARERHDRDRDRIGTPEVISMRSCACAAGGEGERDEARGY